MVVLDISESGAQIGEKLFELLNPKQRNELKQYVELKNVVAENVGKVPQMLVSETGKEDTLLDIKAGDLYFCPAQRVVTVCGKVIELTPKEFDLLALLISNPKRLFTYEMIAEIVWGEVYDIYTRKTITNHVSSLRKKLRISPDVPNYIKSIHNVGYRFNNDECNFNKCKAIKS